ncbi:MAG: four-carbon acid sugar kinase family protein [Bacteroidota bacterium]
METLKKLIKSVPPEIPSSLGKIIFFRKQHPKSIVVLDDDPTGCQTVHEVPVLTTWEVSVLKNEFEKGTLLFFILTNSRSLSEKEAVLLNKEIARNLQVAAQASKKSFTVISRSDSTLRGHYPAEINAFKASLKLERAIEIIAPVFFEGGRYTAKGVHYVEEEGQLILASQTPFAKDVSFGYKNAVLAKWVEEKTKGNVKASDVKQLSLTEIRTKTTEALTHFFTNLKPANVCTIDALVPADLEKVALAIHHAEQVGQEFIFRTAATFVQTYGGISKKPLLSKSDFSIAPNRPGLIVAGSYVPKTSAQLAYFISQELPITSIEIDAQKLTTKEAKEEILRCTELMNSTLDEQKHVLLFTSRKYIAGNTPEKQLADGKMISTGVVEIVKNLSKAPSFLIAKGGITSSDIATKALKIERAEVIGQLLPGVPVWKAGEKSRFSDLPYVIFPGNVGDETSLYQAFSKLF